MPEATAAPAPPLEPPGVRPWCQGLFVRPCRSLSAHQRMEKAGVFVRPTNTAPAARSRSVAIASRLATLSLNAGMPFVFGWPASSVLSLIAAGTPCSGPSGSPAACLRSAASALARASSRYSSVNALSWSATCPMRSACASSTSRADAWPVRISRAISVAGSCQNALMPVPRPSRGRARGRP
jgi:hypothetical protein